ncbi:TetR/AcrR family transcriptional regulator [Actinomadura atramentaria]|uniref:TetR/AcrR family transcriptional regulator n=1 Tax=Actinomadura atramentaria TaxID=1990 RepID=UPI00037FF8EE|nr:TetR/AcrR family transcriptional regulator [Actinomadura atramentaria]
MSTSGEHRRRADARRSRAAILAAAVRVLNTDPEAGMEAVAVAAQVTRQTVYAHFPSRRLLLAAVLDDVTRQAVAAMDAARPDEGPAAEALWRLLDASVRTAREHRLLLQAANAVPRTAPVEHELHAPVADRIARVIGRGRRNGEFDGGLSDAWLVTAVIALGHAAGEEVAAGRTTDEEAAGELRASLARLLGHRPPSHADGAVSDPGH